jgi:hypothetical protein
VQFAERGLRSGFVFHRWSWLKKDVVTRSALKMSRDFRHCHFRRNPRAVRATNHRPRITDYYFCQRGVGRGCGVGRDLGVGGERRGGCASNEPISIRPLNTRTKGLPR